MVQKGKHSYCAGQLEIKFPESGKNLIIGDYCSIGMNVIIMLGGDHRMDWISTYPFSEILSNAPKVKGHPQSKGDVVIGNDVWIGDNVTILSGVTIADGACIGASSVVTKNVGLYEIWAGNPARYINRRFNQSEIELLEKIKWWNWEELDVLNAVPILSSGNFEALKELTLRKVIREKSRRENDNDYRANL